MLLSPPLFFCFLKAKEALICWMPHVFFPKPSLWVSWGVHCLTSSSLSPKFLIFRWTCSFSYQVFLSASVLHPPLVSFSSMSWSFTLASTEKQFWGQLIPPLPCYLRGLFLSVLSNQTAPLLSPLPPKLPLGDPHKPMWGRADLVMCQVPARIIPWCRQAGPSGTEEGPTGSLGWSSQWTGERHVVWEEVLFLYVVKPQWEHCEAQSREPTGSRKYTLEPYRDSVPPCCRHFS